MQASPSGGSMQSPPAIVLQLLQDPPRLQKGLCVLARAPEQDLTLHFSFQARVWDWPPHHPDLLFHSSPDYCSQTIVICIFIHPCPSRNIIQIIPKGLPGSGTEPWKQRLQSHSVLASNLNSTVAFIHSMVIC